MGYFDLTKCTIEDTREEIKGEKYCFIITNAEPKRSTALATDSKEERGRWVHELQQRQRGSIRGMRIPSASHSAIF